MITKEKLIEKILNYNKKYNRTQFEHLYKEDKELKDEFTDIIDNNPNYLLSYVGKDRIDYIINSNDIYSKETKIKLYATMDLLCDVCSFLNGKN